MPNVSIKLYPGRTEEQKKTLAEKITKDIAETFAVDPKWISISIEDVPVDDWAEKVYRPEVLDKEDKLFKTPGYNPFDSE